MTSRGPDADGVVAHGPVALGHRRLAIIDLSTRGAQPMVDADLGLTLVFNGCIYNYKELRHQLQADGYRFFSTADSEVVTQGVPQVGRALRRGVQGNVRVCHRRPRHRPGDAGAGPTGHQAALSGVGRPAGCGSPPHRGRCSARAAWTPNWIAFALHHYMTFHSVVPAPRTIYHGVRKLPPATVRVIQPDGNHSDTVYWTPEFGRDPVKSPWSTGDWEAALLDALRTAVKRRMIADVPVGVLLSGGFDSLDRGGAPRRAGPARVGHLQYRFRLRRPRRIRRRVLLFRPVAKTFDTDHHKIHIDASPCRLRCRKPSRR